MQEFVLLEDVEDSIRAFGKFISSPHVVNDINLLRKGIVVMSSLDKSQVRGIWKPAYYMVMAEVYRNCVRLSSKGFINYDNNDIILHIQYLRKALFHCQEYPDLKNILLINLGHAFSDIKRFSEAIKCWEQVLLNRQHSSEAIIATVLCNIGSCVSDMTPLLPNKFLIARFVSIGKKCLEDALTCKSINKSLEQTLRTALSRLVDRERFLLKDNNISISAINYGEMKSDFAFWSRDNVLFLNPLSDISVEPESFADIIDLSFLKEDKYKFLISGYDELKQQYVFSRKMLHESVNENNDMKSKASFRLAYSVLDKLAGLINHYFGLGYDNEVLSYNKIWFTKKSNKKQVAEKLSKTDNPYMIALYWISRDVFLEGEESSDPEAADIAKCRNYIEHRFVEVVKENVFEENYSNSQLLIGRGTLYEKCLKLHCIIRNAMLYFYMAVKWQSLKEDTNIHRIA